MKKNEIEIGKTYIAKVSGRLARVRIASESQYGGWDGRNIETGREVRIRTAARLRREVETQSKRLAFGGGSAESLPE